MNISVSSRSYHLNSIQPMPISTRTQNQVRMQAMTDLKGSAMNSETARLVARGGGPKISGVSSKNGFAPIGDMGGMVQKSNSKKMSTKNNILLHAVAHLGGEGGEAVGHLLGHLLGALA